MKGGFFMVYTCLVRVQYAVVEGDGRCRSTTKGNSTRSSTGSSRPTAGPCSSSPARGAARRGRSRTGWPGSSRRAHRRSGSSWPRSRTRPPGRCWDALSFSREWTPGGSGAGPSTTSPTGCFGDTARGWGTAATTPSWTRTTRSRSSMPALPTPASRQQGGDFRRGTSWARSSAFPSTR